MKRFSALVAFVIIGLFVNAQQPLFVNNPYPKTITVSGSAEMEVIPDEIYVQVILREYQKKGEDKKDIESIKKQFLEAAKSIGIPDSLVSIVSFTGYNDFYWSRKKKKDPT